MADPNTPIPQIPPSPVPQPPFQPKLTTFRYQNLVTETPYYKILSAENRKKFLENLTLNTTDAEKRYKNFLGNYNELKKEAEKIFETKINEDEEKKGFMLGKIGKFILGLFIAIILTALVLLFVSGIPPYVKSISLCTIILATGAIYAAVVEIKDQQKQYERKYPKESHEAEKQKKEREIEDSKKFYESGHDLSRFYPLLQYCKTLTESNLQTLGLDKSNIDSFMTMIGTQGNKGNFANLFLAFVQVLTISIHNQNTSSTKELTALEISSKFNQKIDELLTANPAQSDEIKKAFADLKEYPLFHESKEEPIINSSVNHKQKSYPSLLEGLYNQILAQKKQYEQKHEPQPQPQIDPSHTPSSSKIHHEQGHGCKDRHHDPQIPANQPNNPKPPSSESQSSHGGHSHGGHSHGGHSHG